MRIPYIDPVPGSIRIKSQNRPKTAKYIPRNVDVSFCAVVKLIDGMPHFPETMVKRPILGLDDDGKYRPVTAFVTATSLTPCGFTSNSKWIFTSVKSLSFLTPSQISHQTSASTKTSEFPSLQTWAKGRGVSISPNYLPRSFSCRKQQNLNNSIPLL